MLFLPYRAVMTYGIGYNGLYATTHETVEHDFLQKMYREKWCLERIFRWFHTCGAIMEKYGYTGPEVIFRSMNLVPWSFTLCYDIPIVRRRFIKLGIHLGYHYDALDGIELLEYSFGNNVTVSSNTLQVHRNGRGPAWESMFGDTLSDIENRTIHAFYKPIEARVKDIAGIPGRLPGINSLRCEPFSELAETPNATKEELRGRMAYDIAAHMNYILGHYDFKALEENTVKYIFSQAQTYLVGRYGHSCKEADLRKALKKMGCTYSAKDNIDALKETLHSVHIRVLVGKMSREISNWALAGHIWY